MKTEELMAKVRRLRIVSGRAVDELFAGEYHSAFRGLGMEFAEVREYQPGDDVRAIDWNVTARAGKPFVKRFVEERELTIILAADLSASGRFGTRERAKQETIAELCAVLALAAARNNDKAGFLAFTDRVELFLPAKKGPRHAMRIIREALNFEADSHGTSIAGVLDYLARVLRKRAVVFVISDFLDDGFEQPLRRLARRHDVIAISVADPAERTLPRAGLVQVADAETGEIAVIDLGSGSVRRAFERGARRRDQDLATLLARAGVDRVSVASGQPYIDALLQFFRMRERRRSRT